MEFIETPIFTKQISALVDDESYRSLQNALLVNPEAGDMVRGGGGIRKIRHAMSGRGKSGGIRVIYYWRKNADEIYMLLAYPKNVQDDLTNEQVAVLRNLVKEL